MNDFIINPPEGFKEIRIIKNGDIVVSFVPISPNEVPSNWDTFCFEFPDTKEEYFMDSHSIYKWDVDASRFENPLSFSSKERALAMEAFIKLIRVKDHINGTWIPNYESHYSSRCSLIMIGGVLTYLKDGPRPHPLTFKNEEIAKTFADNFYKLIRTAEEFL